MIDGSVLQSAQRCFEKKSRVVVKMVVKEFLGLGKCFVLNLFFSGVFFPFVYSLIVFCLK